MQDRVPLGDGDLVFLAGPSAFNPQELARAVDPLGFEAFVMSRFEAAEGEIRRLLVERGVSYVWQLTRLEEAVLPNLPAERPVLLRLLCCMISVLSPQREFAVVDRYLLPKGAPPVYLGELLSILEPIVRAVSKLVLITSKKYDPPLLERVFASLKTYSPGCEVRHRVSGGYHDRLWIADQARGLFVGASLNGIGRRYAIADYLASEDVAQIVAALKKDGLV